MKLKNPLLAVADLARSKVFYREVLGLRVVIDFGANVTLTGGLCLQTKESWLDFLGKEEREISFGGNASEVYFEEDDFDGFLEKLGRLEGVEYVHSVVGHRWGDSGRYASTTPTGISLRSGKTSSRSAGAFWRAACPLSRWRRGWTCR